MTSSVRDPNEISNAFNEHFSTRGSRRAREMPSDNWAVYLNILQLQFKACLQGGGGPQEGEVTRQG